MLSLFPSLIVTDAFVTDQVVSWKLACQMEEVLGHGAAIPLTVGGSKTQTPAKFPGHRRLVSCRLRVLSLAATTREPNSP